MAQKVACVELLIKIPEALYESVLNGTYCGNLYEELKHGTPLPKGHGKLIDVKQIKIVRTPGSAVDENTEIIICAIKQYINQLSAIIEADTESEDPE